MMGIYSITNSINGKRYIGSSNDIQIRWNKHLSQLRNKRHYKHLQSAFDKYGEDNFTFTILEECEEGKLLEREDYYIILYNTCDRKYGYNTNLATRRDNYSHSEETKAKIGKAFKGKKLSEEHKNKISEGLKGKISHDEDVKRTIGDKNRRKWMSEETENEIRRLLMERVKGKDIAKQFGFSVQVISRIRQQLKREGVL